MITFTEQDIRIYNEGQEEHKISDHSFAVICFNDNTFDSPYALITDPDSKFREVFDASPEWQAEFWGWMFNNQYGQRPTDGGIVLFNKNNGCLIDPPSQMLTGYIIQFFEERSK